MRNIRIKILTISILLISISSILPWSTLPLKNTFIWWTIYAIILATFISSKRTTFDYRNDKNLFYLKIYLYWVAICIVRGFFVAENYWEFKNLMGTGMVLLLPCSIYVTTNKYAIQKILSFWFLYGLLLFPLILPFISGTGYGRYLVPVSFIALFFPVLNRKWKLITLATCLFVIFISLDARSNVIKFSVPVIFCLLYLFRYYLTESILRALHRSVMLLPIALFIASSFGFFNIFNMESYIEGSYNITKTDAEGYSIEGNLIADTRTLLYEESIASAIKNNYVLLGRTPARGYDSASFGLYLKEILNTGKMERFSNEVSILNIFTWTGLIGVLLYFLIFYRASYLAINSSNSSFLKILGLYVAFRWTYAWVEDFSLFDLSNFILWTIIGMCYSRDFRRMTDYEFKAWLRGILSKEYRLTSAYWIAGRPDRNLKKPLPT